MKVVKSKQLSSFGGINFVYEHLNSMNICAILKKNLPSLGNQSKYTWHDLLYSFLTIYYCGGDCIEDLNTNLKMHIKNNPFIKLTSSDTLLRRMSGLSTKIQTCTTPRGNVTHEYCHNQTMLDLNIDILKTQRAFDKEDNILDYDNTILFNEKKDSKMTYKRDYGYQPGVCTLNENFVLFIENRNGNSDAKSFQSETLKRMFDSLLKKNVGKIKHFRADAASYQHDVIDLLREKVQFFYIGCRNSYVEDNFSKITEWTHVKDELGELEIGSINYTPFEEVAKQKNKKCYEYRLVVKRRKNKDGQINMITQDDYEYRAILTNNFNIMAEEVVDLYNKRGNMERQFDILKNDFGWNNMPFSKLEKNLVFLYFSAICRNLYNSIIIYFSNKTKRLNPNFRIKKFIFRFIILPVKWIIQGRQQKLRVYSYADIF